MTKPKVSDAVKEIKDVTEPEHQAAANELGEATTQVAARDETLPDYLQGYDGPTGDENIDQADITIPRLKIGQAISDEVKNGALKEGALFLNVIGDAIWNPGDAPLPVLIVAQSKEYILWNPREDGGGILARAKPVVEKGIKRYKWDNPNEEFVVKVGGKIRAVWATKQYIDEDELNKWGSEIPGDKESGIAATAHHNYLVMLPTHMNIVAAISMSRTAVKVANALNAAIKMGDRRYPLPVRRFNIVTVDDVNDNGDTFKNWSFKPNGYLGREDSVTAAAALAYFKQFAEGGYVVEQEPVSTAAAAGAKNSDMGGDDIPF